MKSKIASLCLVFNLVVCGALIKTPESVFADNQKSVKMDLVYTQVDSYTVELPKVMDVVSTTNARTLVGLKNNTCTDEYTIAIKGSIGENETLIVKPVKNTIVLTDVTSSTVRRDDVIATIVQSDTEWTAAELKGGKVVKKSGLITCNDLKAGKWKGTIVFNVERKGES